MCHRDLESQKSEGMNLLKRTGSHSVSTPSVSCFFFFFIYFRISGVIYLDIKHPCIHQQDLLCLNTYYTCNF